MNFLALAVAALVPLVVGMVWYNPKVFGTVWAKETGMTEEDAKSANMLLIFGLTYLFSFMAAVLLQMNVVHQLHLDSIVMNEMQGSDQAAADEAKSMVEAFKAKYGTNFRTFKHGAFHGVIVALFFALPVIGINSLFERKSFKYIAINVGYWVAAFAIMGGIISGWM